MEILQEEIEQGSIADYGQINEVYESLLLAIRHLNEEKEHMPEAVAMVDESTELPHNETKMLKLFCSTVQRVKTLSLLFEPPIKRRRNGDFYETFTCRR